MADEPRPSLITDVLPLFLPGVYRPSGCCNRANPVSLASPRSPGASLPSKPSRMSREGGPHILGSSLLSRGASPSTYSALPVCYGRGAATYSAPPVCRAPLPVCRGFLPATFSALDIRHCIPSLFYIHLVL